MLFLSTIAKVRTAFYSITNRYHTKKVTPDSFHLFSHTHVLVYNLGFYSTTQNLEPCLVEQSKLLVKFLVVMEIWEKSR